MRGLRNTTGTACHLNAALMVWRHCLDILGDPDAVELLLVDVSHGKDPNLQDAGVSNAQQPEHHSENQHKGDLQDEDDDDARQIILCSWRRIFRELDASSTSPSEENATIAVDPTDLYDRLQRLYHSRRNRTSTVHKLDAQSLGDAVLALERLLQLVLLTPLNNNNTNNNLALLYNALLGAGRIQSVLTGTKRGYKSRTKRLPERTLANPFPLPLTTNAETLTSAASTTNNNNEVELNLHTALQRVLLQDVPVSGDGYSWPETRPSDCAMVGHWQTSRRQCVREFPPIWMLHLQRFGVVADDSSTTTTATNQQQRQRFQLQAIDGQQCWTIPATLDVREYLVVDSDNDSHPTTTTNTSTQQSTIFHLRGGILHVSEPTDHRSDQKNSIDIEEEESGHYVAVICQNNNQWCLVDDDHVQSNVPLDRVLRWLGGDWYHHDSPSPPNHHHASDDALPNDHFPQGINTGDVDCQHVENDGGDDECGLTAASYLRGVLLIYHREDLAEITNPWMEQLQQSRQETHHHRTDSTSATTVGIPTVDNTHDPGWIGRRLRVRWKNGTYYSGTVTSYDPDRRQHTVTYDDGDVRHYRRLANKTIEWLVDNDHQDPEEDYDNTTIHATVVADTHDDLRDWVGRRLRVQWKGGVYYAGQVTGFDPDTGKHTVTYEDGDVRNYRLSQKTWEWIDGGWRDSDADEDHGELSPK